MRLKSQFLAYTLGLCGFGAMTQEAQAQHTIQEQTLTRDNHLSHKFKEYFGDSLQTVRISRPASDEETIQNWDFHQKFVKNMNTLIVHAKINDNEDIIVIGHDDGEEQTMHGRTIRIGELDDSLSVGETQRILHYKIEGNMAYVTSVSKVEGSDYYMVTTGGRAKVPEGTTLADMTDYERLILDFKKAKLSYAEHPFAPFENNRRRIFKEKQAAQKPQPKSKGRVLRAPGY